MVNGWVNTYTFAQWDGRAATPERGRRRGSGKAAITKSALFLSGGHGGLSQEAEAARSRFGRGCWLAREVWRTFFEHLSSLVLAMRNEEREAAVAEVGFLFGAADQVAERWNRWDSSLADTCVVVTELQREQGK